MTDHKYSGADGLIDKLNDLCERHGCLPGTDRLEWIDRRLSATADVTGAMVERALAAYYASRGGSDDDYIRANFTNDMRLALIAAIATQTDR